MGNLFAVCAPGLEAVLAGELMELGLLKRRLILGPPAESGGVAFEGGDAQLRRANLLLRTAERVLVRLEPFPAPDFESLVKGASRLPWERWLAPGRPVAVRADSRSSRLYHEKAVAERVAQAVSVRLKAESPLARWDEGAPVQLVYARLEKDACALAVDASGAPLHRRGWRRETGKAPLRETLAAALLRASGWDRRSPLADPFCGSGTIAIEAALLARGAPAGKDRRFAFMEWPGFDEKKWSRETTTATDCAPPAAARILASDRDEGVVAAAQANAERAGVAGAIEFSVRPVSALALPRGPGWVVTNPPYGVRVSEGKDLRGLYAAFGKAARVPDWSVSLVAASALLVRATGLRLEPGLSTLNGSLSVRFHHARGV